MLKEELIDFLQHQNKKDILLKMQGIITTSMIIEKCQTRQENNQLVLESTINSNKKVGLNLSQLMKITQTKINEILLEFDQLQQVIISLGY